MKELNGIKYIERKPTIETDHSQLFLLIHGYGSNEEDLFSFSPDLPATAHVISVRGIYNLPFGGYSWYDISFENNEKYMDTNQAANSKDALVKFIDEIIIQENLDTNNVFIAGFSQGESIFQLRLWLRYLITTLWIPTEMYFLITIKQ